MRRAIVAAQSRSSEAVDATEHQFALALEETMDRSLRTLAVAIAMTLLVAGVAQAAKPVTGTPAGQAWADTTGNNPIEIPGGFAQAVITSVTLPPDGRFVVNATVELFNNDQEADRSVVCTLTHGQSGTLLDIAHVNLLPTTPTISSSVKVPLTGVVERVAASPSTDIRVTCSSALGAGAQFGQLNVVSVSSLTRS
jgi:hypothetical protein